VADSMSICPMMQFAICANLQHTDFDLMVIKPTVFSLCIQHSTMGLHTSQSGMFTYH